MDKSKLNKGFSWSDAFFDGKLDAYDEISTFIQTLDGRMIPKEQVIDYINIRKSEVENG